MKIYILLIGVMSFLHAKNIDKLHVEIFQLQQEYKWLQKTIQEYKAEQKRLSSYLENVKKNPPQEIVYRLTLTHLKVQMRTLLNNTSLLLQKKSEIKSVLRSKTQLLRKKLWAKIAHSKDRPSIKNLLKQLKSIKPLFFIGKFPIAAISPHEYFISKEVIEKRNEKKWFFIHLVEVGQLEQKKLAQKKHEINYKLDVMKQIKPFTVSLKNYQEILQKLTLAKEKIQNSTKKIISILKIARSNLAMIEKYEKNEMNRLKKKSRNR